MPAPSSSAKHRSSSWPAGRVDALQQHALVAHVAHAGGQHRLRRLGHQRRHRLRGVDVRVDGEGDAPRAGRGRQPGHALDDVVLQPVLGQAHERLGGQPDVADRLDLQQAGDERLEVLERQVRDVAAGDDDVAHAGGGAQVVEHRGLPVDRLELELELRDGGRRVAHQVHAGAVAAVLRAGRQQLGQHLGGVAVGEALDGPHLVLVQRVAGGVRVARGRAGQPVGGDREHVPAHRVGEHAPPSTAPRPGTIVLSICGGSSSDIVARPAWSASTSA